MIELYQNKL